MIETRKADLTVPDKREKYQVLLLLLIYCVAEIVYGCLSDATWDDDCPTRYYNTLNAFHDPKNFIDIWNRPLFVLLFSIPVHFGKHSIVVLMSIITAGSAWCLYRYCKESGMKNSLMVVPFFLFQAYVFGISRNAETEPLASALICFGLLQLVRRNYVWFAVIGGLLPLARLELTPLLLFWIAILVKRASWKHTLLLFVPLIAWNLCGYFFSKDPVWLWHAVTGDNTNRYGQQSFGHYFQRYVYVLGPIVFYFFFVGLSKLLVTPRKNVFILWQFIAGFLLYVILSWKLSMGDAAGFLRNLIPLSPFAAVIALEGFSLWNDTLVRTNEVSRSQRINISAASVIAVLLSFLFFSQKLEKHFTLTDEHSFLNLVCVGVPTVLLLAGFAIHIGTKTALVFRVMIVSAVTAFALITENWSSNMNPEREVMEKVSALCAKGAPRETIYANHIWFYWCNNIDKNDFHYPRLTKQVLPDIQNSSLVVWDAHYSPGHGGDVALEDLTGNPGFIELFRIRASDNKFVAIVFERVASDNSDMLQAYEKALRNFPEMTASIYVNRGEARLQRLNDTTGALSDFDIALKTDSTNIDAWFNKGLALFLTGNHKGSAEAFRMAAQLNPQYAQAYLNRGVALTADKQYDEAIKSYNEAIAIDKNYQEAYRNRAVVYDSLKNYAAEIQDLSMVISLVPADADALLHRGVAYFHMQNIAKARTDLDRAILTKNDLADAYYYRGLLELEAHDEASACSDFVSGYQLGNADCKKLWDEHCGKE